jgi:hypothetical protein
VSLDTIPALIIKRGRHGQLLFAIHLRYDNFIRSA